VGAEAAAGGAAGSGRRRGRVLVRSGRARRGLAPRSYVALGSWLCGWLGLERTCGPARRCNGSRSRYGAATGPVSSTCSSGTARSLWRQRMEEHWARECEVRLCEVVVRASATALSTVCSIRARAWAAEVSIIPSRFCSYSGALRTSTTSLVPENFCFL
jgi:hypothetical protein